VAHTQSMAQTQINLVQVTPDNGKRRVWLAAAPPEEAVARVLDRVPEGWSAVLLRLRPVDGSGLKMQSGEVRELARQAAPHPEPKE
jgi:hypothetical protein